MRQIFDEADRFFDKEDRNPVSINHRETAQIAVSRILKHSEETGLIPDCSFYLAVSMSWHATVPKTLVLARLGLLGLGSPITQARPQLEHVGFFLN